VARKISGLRRKIKATASATTHTAETTRVKTGETWFIDLIALRNQTRANSDVIVSVQNHGYDHVIGQSLNLSDNVWTTIDRETRLFEGEYLKFAWADVVSGDVLDMHITGHKHYREEK